MQDSIFEVVTTTTGATSIRNKRLNETMHNPVGPWLEANSLYIEQSSLRERLSSNLNQELVIFDVGLGAAANSLAAIHCARSLKKHRPLRIVSFERDLDLLRFALEKSKNFEHFYGYEGAIESLLKNSVWNSDYITWELRHGDFVSLIEKESQLADIVFYDPYSPNVNTEMWTLSLFQKLKQKCRVSEEGALLLTYSKATPVRVALLCSGFYVGAGCGTGEKDETTIAATKKDLLANPFSDRWFTRWKNSSVPYPLGTVEAEQALIREMICAHEQFQDLA
ncbi:MAG: MnmC family methyltransferase [Bdellovibrionota bacterium]